MFVLRSKLNADPHMARAPPSLASQDGVLKQGDRVLPQALEVLRMLTGENPKGKKYPFILASLLLSPPLVGLPR